MAECRLYLWTVLRQRKFARKKYRVFVEKMISEGKPRDLSDDGLLMSIGGWAALIKCFSSGELLCQFLSPFDLGEKHINPPKGLR
ncbi:MAG: hypothetical protein QGG48_00470, partial [Desulfatiglandales bacterium]|nr:hypothetical protein [Desulfatiglandales bacterium]